MFHGTFRFIDDLYALNDGGEIQKWCKEIYPKELALKLEQLGTHATFLVFNITISNDKIWTKLNNKRDGFFSFFCSHVKLL